MKRIFIYTLLILATLLLPSNSVAKPPEKTIIKVVPEVVQQETIKPVSFASATQLASIYIAPVSTVVSNCGDNMYSNYIYEHESGCNLDAVNPSSGDYGLGQSANGLSSACPDWQTDYTCQNSFFTSYANSRYGGWEQAYLVWISQGWW